jgi:hypothetical protein
MIVGGCENLTAEAQLICSVRDPDPDHKRVDQCMGCSAELTRDLRFRCSVIVPIEY